MLIYCSAGLYCQHSAVVDADRWPDNTVLLDLDAKAVCTNDRRRRAAELAGAIEAR